ncbi:rhamnulokinase [Scatolibacter rhodanostii]|uniref:rhamnulokinase n=1 Tax=Scatolibacter rhodanostii TaxID=2014781 RepID=UPI000C0773CA|nr:rhamnulokinase [Scatolibacter rhodanostii]
MRYYLAIDIGASSGRHILGWVENGKIKIKEVYRFDNVNFQQNGYLVWDTKALFKHILNGMKQCKEQGKVPETVAIDTWGVDYVLLDEKGEALSEAVCYRDKRTKEGIKQVEDILPFTSLYQIAGIQNNAFNTVYQLMAEKLKRPEMLLKAKQILMLPAYFNYLLTGECKNEYTHATTTSLVNAKTKTWDSSLLKALGFPETIFGKLYQPGTLVGNLLDEVQKEVGFDCSVMLAASHDTASAYLSVPANNESAAYLSSGTWSLLGTEIEEPILSEEALKANFSNEGGFNYRYRFLQNIMGLWLIQSIRRSFDKKYSFAELEIFARQEADFASIIDANDNRFLNPENMIEEVKLACHESGQAVPENIGQLVQCVYQSLAQCYAKAVKGLSVITNKIYTDIHIVGGGSKDTYLNQLTANCTGLPIHAGPTEGTVIGNLICQMIAAQEYSTLAEARHAVRESFEIKTYLPQ